MKSLPTKIYTNTQCNYMSNRIRNCRNGLVIFPMSGNNTFEISDFADQPFPFRNRDGGVFSPRKFHGRKYCVT